MHNVGLMSWAMGCRIPTMYHVVSVKYCGRSIRQDLGLIKEIG